MAVLSLNGVAIRSDALGRYSLNDFHKAAGEADKDRPNEWLKLKKTKALLAEVEIEGIPSIEAKQRVGTFAVENLVIAYAMWISARFHAHVIETFKQAAIAKANAARVEPESAKPALEDKTIAVVSRGVMLLDILAGSKSYGLTKEEHRNGIHKLFRTNGLPTDMLPAPTDDAFSGEGTATHMLLWFGRCLPAQRFFKLLEDHGIVFRHVRPSTKKDCVMRYSWRFTTAGLRFGFDKDLRSGRDYRPLFYPSRFLDLLRIIAPDVQRLVDGGEYKPRWPRSENEQHAREYRAKFEKNKPVDQANSAHEAYALR
ncbi:hypothetical protein EOS_32930 [Caballeronia mineralivorans PML1(12)]|uniref:KilA-N domain-containing protein n=1 Tax=Caballeronia mineralivorans PML1(12) TaxID=908627 RepID=A0A0J1CNH7_9BURK|nr:KilA-N domain-containing protein [Caballeronia mineralivorans]KLU21951.1 hypothetical protein EOS_32930 [Caballeronia mineralivorans PML1(12)]